MNDKRIEQLLRMAVEADELEASADDRPAVIARLDAGGVHPAGAAWGRRPVWIGLATAACAALAFAGAWFIGVKSGTPQAGSGQVAVDPVPEVKPPVEVAANHEMSRPIVTVSDPVPSEGSAGSAGGGGEQSVVLAIFHDLHSGLQCVQWQPHDWNGNKCLSDVPAQEVRGVNMGKPCSTSSRQMVMVALSGPKAELPTNDAKAVELADCILGGERYCDSDGSCYMAATTRCVPPNVSFKIETVAYNR